MVRVLDSGAGIPPERLDDVFDLFTQVNPSLARTEGGLGIGLTLVKRLVDLHGGEVRAYSDGLGTGSEFVVRLPLAREAVQIGRRLPVGAIAGSAPDPRDRRQH